MHRRLALLGLFSCLATLAYGQHLLSFGIKGGVPLTDAFADSSPVEVDVIVHSFSASKNYVIGPMAELNLPLGFSVEADALYRPLNLTIDSRVLPLPNNHFSTDLNSWEFPILGKYHFLHTPVVKPYVEAGPIFRAVGSQGSNLSKDGFALGGGVDLKVLLVRVTPEVRYSRWGSDATGGPGYRVLPSNRNQAEFLIGISF
jgi:hypothetical protein